MSRVNLKPEMGSYSLQRAQSRLPLASELCSVQSMLETEMTSVNPLMKVGVGLVVAKADVMFLGGMCIGEDLSRSRHIPREHLLATHIHCLRRSKRNMSSLVK